MLATSAILVSLSISQLGMSVKSDPITDAAHKAIGITDKRAGYYRKFKIDRKDVFNISKTANAARSYHRTMTVPWGHDSYRMLPAILTQKYTRQIKTFKLEFESYVKDLQVRWPIILASSKTRLGPAFNKNEYPGVQDIINLCTFEIHFKPVPQDDHFILNIEKKTLDEVKQNLISENEKNLKKISEDLWKRLYEAVERMAIRLNDKDPRIYETLVTNIEELLDILPALNLTHDAKLNEMCSEVKQKLCIFTPGQLRKDKTARNKTAKEAVNIQNKMAAIMGKR